MTINNCLLLTSVLAQGMIGSSLIFSSKYASNFRIRPISMMLRTSQRGRIPRTFVQHPTNYLNRITPSSFSCLNLSTKSPDEESLKGKVTALWKNYGVVAIGTYFSVYILTLGSIYTSLEFDIFNAATFGLDPVSAVKKFCDIVEGVTGSSALPGYIRDRPSVGTFAIAWVMTKFTEPLRLLFTVSIVPKFARAIGRAPPLSKGGDAQ